MRFYRLLHYQTAVLLTRRNFLLATCSSLLFTLFTIYYLLLSRYSLRVNYSDFDFIHFLELVVMSLLLFYKEVEDMEDNS